MVLYELLTGTDPYPGMPDEDVTDPVGAYLPGRTVKLPEPPSRRNQAVTPAVDAIVRKLLEPDPAKRYAEAAHVREDLERQLANRPLVHAKETSVRERVRKWRRRNPRLTAGVAVALAALVFLILPATAVAIRSEQLAARRHEVARSEAILAHQKAIRELQDRPGAAVVEGARPGPDRRRVRSRPAILDDYAGRDRRTWADRSRVHIAIGRSAGRLATGAGRARC